jgi:hypothetical protein
MLADTISIADIEELDGERPIFSGVMGHSHNLRKVIRIELHLARQLHSANIGRRCLLAKLGTESLDRAVCRTYIEENNCDCVRSVRQQVNACHLPCKTEERLGSEQ